MTFFLFFKLSSITHEKFPSTNSFKFEIASGFLSKYGDPITTECWENSKHERVCKTKNSCKFLRNFCIEEVYRWRAE